MVYAANTTAVTTTTTTTRANTTPVTTTRATIAATVAVSSNRSWHQIADHHARRHHPNSGHDADRCGGSALPRRVPSAGVPDLEHPSLSNSWETRPPVHRRTVSVASHQASWTSPSDRETLMPSANAPVACPPHTPTRSHLPQVSFHSSTVAPRGLRGYALARSRPPTSRTASAASVRTSSLTGVLRGWLRKVIYRVPDGNELGFGGAPLDADS
jgi:hypothetical protein